MWSVHSLSSGCLTSGSPAAETCFRLTLTCRIHVQAGTRGYGGFTSGETRLRPRSKFNALAGDHTETFSLYIGTVHRNWRLDTLCWSPEAGGPRYSHSVSLFTADGNARKKSVSPLAMDA